MEMRKNDSAMNADTFHHLLSLARFVVFILWSAAVVIAFALRLVSLSYGKNTLSSEQWAIAKRLNCLRQARIT